MYNFKALFFFPLVHLRSNFLASTGFMYYSQSVSRELPMILFLAKEEFSARPRSGRSFFDCFPDLLLDSMPFVLWPKAKFYKIFSKIFVIR